MKQIVFQNGIDAISENLFSQSEVKSVCIPRTVRTIQKDAFKSCCKLEKLVFEDGSLLNEI